MSSSRPSVSKLNPRWVLLRYRRRRQFIVLPLDDFNPIDGRSSHVEPGPNCWCKPKIELHGKATLVIHHAADGRELVETHGVM